jgi:hypothetical protein
LGFAASHRVLRYFPPATLRSVAEGAIGTYWYVTFGNVPKPPPYIDEVAAEAPLVAKAAGFYGAARNRPAKTMMHTNIAMVHPQ